MFSCLFILLSESFNVRFYGRGVYFLRGVFYIYTVTDDVVCISCYLLREIDFLSNALKFSRVFLLYIV